LIRTVAAAILLLLPGTLAGWEFEPHYGIGPAQGIFSWTTSGEGFRSTLNWTGLQSRRERLGVRATHRLFELTLLLDRGTIEEGSVEDVDDYGTDSARNSHTRHNSRGDHRSYGMMAGVHLGDRSFQVVPQLLWFKRRDHYTIGAGYDLQNHTTHPVDSHYTATIKGFGAGLKLLSDLSADITLQGGIKAIVAAYEGDAYWDQREPEERHFAHKSDGTLQSSWVGIDMRTALNLTLWARFEKNRFEGQSGEDTTPALDRKQPFQGATLDEYLWLFGLKTHL
jgi:hypothetical protein